MESHGILIYMAADNDLNPYGRFNDLKEIQGAQSAADSWPLAVQFHSPGGGDKEGEGILSIAFHQGHEIVRKQQRRGINTGDPESLSSFLHWAHQVLQCQKYSLVIWGHGSGPLDAEKMEDFIDIAKSLKDFTRKSRKIEGFIKKGGAPPTYSRSAGSSSFGGVISKVCRKNKVSQGISKKERKEKGFISESKDMEELTTKKSVTYDYTENDALTTAELYKALSDFQKDIQFPVLGFDACYMASIEVMVELAPLCQVYVASEARVPDIGWPYQLILEDLADNQPTDSAAMGQVICNHFMSLFPPQKPACISAVASDKLSAVVDSMRTLVELLLKNISNPVIFLALYKAKTNANLFGDKGKENFVDLYSLVRNLALYCPSSSVLVGAARKVGQKVKECILANRSQGFEMAEGLSILFPYAPPSDIISRRYKQLSFCKETRWDELLVAFHRGGQK